MVVGCLCVEDTLTNKDCHVIRFDKKRLKSAFILVFLFETSTQRRVQIIEYKEDNGKECDSTFVSIYGHYIDEVLENKYY